MYFAPHQHAIKYGYTHTTPAALRKLKYPSVSASDGTDDVGDASGRSSADADADATMCRYCSRANTQSNEMATTVKGVSIR